MGCATVQECRLTGTDLRSGGGIKNRGRPQSQITTDTATAATRPTKQGTAAASNLYPIPTRRIPIAVGIDDSLALFTKAPDIGTPGLGRQNGSSGGEFQMRRQERGVPTASTNAAAKTAHGSTPERYAADRSDLRQRSGMSPEVVLVGGAR